MLVTCEAKVRDASVYPLLDAAAELYARAERNLFVDRYVDGRPLKDLKREFLVRFGLTARQFNAIAAELSGKVQAARESARHRVASLRRRTASVQKAVAAIEARLSQTRPEPGAKRQLRFHLHQKRRRLRGLRDQLARAEAEAARSVPGICFGGRKRFAAQFHLEENDYASHEQWLADWRAARSSQFFCLGSNDEKGGNQTCTLSLDGTLRLRVPNALIPQFGHWVVLRDVRFSYGQDVIDRALLGNQPISYRFVRREKKMGRPVWYVQATTERPDVEIITRRALGGLGVDLNPHLVAVARIDRHGNPAAWRHIPVCLQGRRREQVKAALGEAVAEIVAWAKSEGVPIVIERLDFEEKKARLREMHPRYARMLSAFAYRQFHALLESRAAREGVAVIPVNPAFTSVIGQVKFASGYGISPHASAAVAIARRGLNFGERLRARSRSALPLPARNRGRHVWSDWRRVSQRLRALKRARGRRPSEGGVGQGKTPIRRGTSAGAARWKGPCCDVRPVPGCDPPAPGREGCSPGVSTV